MIFKHYLIFIWIYFEDFLRSAGVQDLVSRSSPQGWPPHDSTLQISRVRAMEQSLAVHVHSGQASHSVIKQSIIGTKQGTEMILIFLKLNTMQLVTPGGNYCCLIANDVQI